MCTNLNQLKQGQNGYQHAQAARKMQTLMRDILYNSVKVPPKKLLGSKHVAYRALDPNRNYDHGIQFVKDS